MTEKLYAAFRMSTTLVNFLYLIETNENHHKLELRRSIVERRQEIVKSGGGTT